MKLFFKFFLFLFFFIISNSSFLYAKEFNAVYLIEVGTVNIGKLIWNIQMSKNDYKISIILEDKGLLSGLYKFNGKYEASGLIFNKILKPLEYKQNWVTNKKEKNVKIIFNNNSLAELLLFPEEKEHQRIQYIGIKNFFDPLSSFLNILMGENQSKTIDGRRTYLMIVDKSYKKDGANIRKVLIKNYMNIWSDHKRKDLEHIEIIQQSNGIIEVLPMIIKIKFKGLTFKLKKI